MQGVPSSIPHQGTRSHMLQLRIHMPQLKIPHATMRSKILCAAAKTWHSQIQLFFLSVTGGFAGSSVVNSPPWMQGTLVWPPVREDHTCCRANKLVHHNYWATRCSYWSPGSQSPCPETREAAAAGSLRTAAKSSPRWPQLEKANLQQQRPSTAQT